MKTKYFIITIFLLIGLAVFVDKIIAQESNQMSAIQYPVEELGNCENKADCKAYCDKPKNSDACLDFAQKNNLMTEQEIKVAKKFLSNEIEGPGGCTAKDSCEAYCNDINHIDECISFAENNNLIPPEELEEAKKVQAAIKRGAKPPPCGNKKQCDIYCEEPEHMEECIAFGIEAGFIHGKELEDVQKMLQAVRRGVKPPPCKGREACDEYCSSPDNMEVCMTFAMEAGFMSEQEKADSQKMLQALKKGVKPPPCKGREECDAYCGQEEHLKECMNFAVAAGFMTEEDAKMARKTGGKGPGDCKGKEECETFCNNPDNQQTCFNFAKDNGMIPEEDLKKMEAGQQQIKQSFEQMPVEAEECLNSAVGADMVEKMKSGFMPPREMGEKMRECFQKIGPPQEGRPGESGMIPPAGQTGPGGCKTPEECKSYCESNPQNCQQYPGPNGQQQGLPPCQGDNFQNIQYQPMQPGEMPTQCVGDNCSQMAPPSPGDSTNMQQQQQFAPGTGPNNMLLQEGMAPGIAPSRENISPPPPPSGEPGSRGSLIPGEQVPSAPSTEQTAPSEPPPPPPPPPISSFLNPRTFLGSVLYIIARGLYSLR